MAKANLVAKDIVKVENPVASALAFNETATFRIEDFSFCIGGLRVRF